MTKRLMANKRKALGAVPRKRLGKLSQHLDLQVSDDGEEQDHIDLASLLDRFEHTTIVVRYGDDPLLRELYREPDWQWVDAKSRTQANNVREEVWIVRNGSQGE